jgi:Fic family protein
MAKVIKPPIVSSPKEAILQELERNTTLSRIITESVRDHLYWTEVKYKLEAKTANIKPEDVWSVIKFMRKPNSRIVKIGGFEIKLSIPDGIDARIHNIDNRLKNIERGNIFSPETDVGERFIRESLMEEAIASSIMEGANTTRRIAKDMLNENRKPKNAEERMVSNNYRTMEFIREMEDKITPEAIINIQAMLTEGTLKHPEDVGKLRTTDEIVVSDQRDISKDYIPPSHEKIRIGLEGLCSFANEGNEMHPLLKACIIHYFIGYLHPFNDGNGRTARALFYWFMIKSGYRLMEIMPISTIIRKSPGIYAESYRRAELDENDVTYFIRYNFTVLEKALKQTKEYIEERLREYETLLKHAKLGEKLNERQVDILQKALKRPEKGIAIAEVQNLYGVVYQTARTDLLKLAHLGYLEKRKVRHKFVFMPPKNLKKLL